MTPSSIIDSLTLSNRAYQVLYALGDDSSTVRTLAAGEAFALVQIASDIFDGHIQTPFDRVLSNSIHPGVLRYVATGR